MKINITGWPKATHLGSRHRATTQQNKTALTGEVIWIEDRGITIPENKIIASPQVGINIAEPYKSIY
ncbi:MAG: hypothetical protein ABI045_04725 [Flavobacteriales bacterium]